jgi:hemophore-related protein
MAHPVIVKGVVALGGLLAAVLLVPSVVASAEPGDGPLIETTCSYAQLVAALRVENPELAALLDKNPEAQAKLQQLVALSVDERRQRLQSRLDANPQWRDTIEQKRNTPQGQEKEQMLLRIADTCHSY